MTDDPPTSEELLAVCRERLARLERIAALGELAPFLVHELKQPLHAARTYAGVARRRLSAHRAEAIDEVLGHLGEVVKAVDRAAGLVTRLHAFASGQAIPWERCDFNRIVLAACRAMEEEIGAAEAEFQVDLADGLPEILGDPLLLQQVGVNLIRNACDALQGVPQDRRRLRVGTRKVAGGVCLQVEDSGQGVPGPLRGSLFLPFRSGKEAGMGVGLALSRQVVEAHRGEIALVEPTVEFSTIVQIFLPEGPKAP